MTTIHSVPDDGPDDDLYAPEANIVDGVDAAFKKGAVPVKLGRPKKDEFFRINPDPDYVHDYWLLTIDDGKDKENYIVAKSLRKIVADDLHPHRLFVGINRHDTLFVWPIRLYTDGDSGGGGESWSESALEKAERAKALWIKIRGDRSAGGYSSTEAQGDWEAPDFGSLSFRDIVEKAFKGRVIDRPDHPALEKFFMRKTK